MKGGLERCMPIELRYEGGFANRGAADRGGRTLEGITWRVYDGYRDRKGLLRRQLTPEMRYTPDWIAERNEIYRLQYWNAVRGDELPQGVDLFLFDSGILSGPYQAVLWLQRALAAAGLYHDPIDGHLGETTLSALEAHQNHAALIADMASRRLGMMQGLSTWSANKDGWTARVANVKAIASAWARDDHAAAPEPVDAHVDGHDKAYASDVAQPAIDATVAASSGVGSGTIGAVVNQAKDSLAPVAYSNEWVMHAFTALTLLAVVLTIGGLGYAWWSSRKAAKARNAIDGNVMAVVPDTYAPQGA